MSAFTSSGMCWFIWFLNQITKHLESTMMFLPKNWLRKTNYIGKKCMLESVHTILIPYL